MKKEVRFSFVSLGIFFLMVSLALGSEKKDLKFASDWVFHGGYAPFFVALEKGLYTERGLKVSVERGYGAADGIKRLLGGANDLIFGDSGAAILARADGAKVKLAGLIYEKAPFVIYSLKKSGITEPKHLEGKKIATNAGDANYLLFPALARATGIDAKKIIWVTVSPPQKIPVLMAEKVAAMTLFVISEPIVAQQAAKLGGYNRILYADYGVDIYSNGITALDKFIAENPGSVRGFVQGTVKAYEYSFAHLDEAVRIILKYQPHLEPGISRASLEAVKAVVLTPAAKANGVGWVVEEKMRRTRDIILSAYGKTAQVSLQDIYTNQFLR